MYLANTCAEEATVVVAEVKEPEEVSHTESLAMAPEDLEHLKLAASQDVAMQEL